MLVELLLGAACLPDGCVDNDEIVKQHGICIRIELSKARRNSVCCLCSCLIFHRFRVERIRRYPRPRGDPLGPCFHMIWRNRSLASMYSPRLPGIFVIEQFEMDSHRRIKY